MKITKQPSCKFELQKTLRLKRQTTCFVSYFFYYLYRIVAEGKTKLAEVFQIEQHILLIVHNKQVKLWLFRACMLLHQSEQEVVDIDGCLNVQIIITTSGKTIIQFSVFSWKTHKLRKNRKKKKPLLKFR